MQDVKVIKEFSARDICHIEKREEGEGEEERKEKEKRRLSLVTCLTETGYC